MCAQHENLHLLNKAANSQVGIESALKSSTQPDARDNISNMSSESNVRHRTLDRILAAVLSLVLLIFITSCNKSGSDVNKGTNPDQSSVEAVNPGTDKIKLDDNEIINIENYLNNIVNGNFRELTDFPYFTSVAEIPAIVFSSGNLLQLAKSELGGSKISRADYEAFLVENVNETITLPANANYQRGYDQASDTFDADLQLPARNFYPESFWVEPKLSQADDKIYFDAYEFNYEFVNQDTGVEESNNPLARIVVDEVTIGFTAPLASNDLDLLDYKPLARTRYTLKKLGSNRYQLLSKTRLEADDAYKNSAKAIYANIKASYGETYGLKGDNLLIRSYPDKNSKIYGSLGEGVAVWYIDPLADSEYFLLAPAALGNDIYNYDWGFGFASKKHVH